MNFDELERILRILENTNTSYKVKLCFEGKFNVPTEMIIPCHLLPKENDVLSLQENFNGKTSNYFDFVVCKRKYVYQNFSEGNPFSIDDLAYVELTLQHISSSD